MTDRPELTAKERMALDRVDRSDASAEAWERGRVEACTGPRGYPYGLGTGEVLQWGVGRRPLLLLEGERVRVAEPAFYRTMCAALGAGGTAESE